jgi:parallel beta-helix repeat protein
MTFSRKYLGLAFIFVLTIPHATFADDSAITQNHRLIATNPQSQPLQNLRIAQANTIIFVSPNGSDANSGLSADQALRSITAAIARNPQAGTVIQLAEGNYTAATGEKFPLIIPTGVTLRGNPANQGLNVVISGGDRFVSPTFAPQNIAMLASNNTTIEGITLTNSNPRGYALWLESAKNVTITNNIFAKSTHDGVFLTGDVSANVSNNVFTQNGANGISALGTSTGQIQSNTFDNTGFGLAIGQKSQVAVIANRIVNNRGGIVISNLSTPTVRNNLIANNQENGLTILKDRNGQPMVNLGTTASPGQNIFQDNKQADINNASGVTVVAIGNQIDAKRTQGSIEITQPTSPITPPNTPINPIANVSFSDVPANYWAQGFIQELASRNIIKGFPDGSFRPNAPVTRAQFAAMLNQAIDKAPIRASINFADIPNNFWAAPAIQKAHTIGFMSGYPNNLFKPSENISRVQILVALANGFNYNPTQPAANILNIYSDAAAIPNYAKNSIAAATENRLVVNYPTINTLKPNQPATRAEVAALIYQALVRSGKAQPITSPYIVVK